MSSKGDPTAGWKHARNSDSEQQRKSKFGGEWKGLLLYNPDVTVGDFYDLSKDTLNERIKILEDLGLIDQSDQVVEYDIYATDIVHRYVSLLDTLRHEFVIFKTLSGWWWALEKFSDTIKLQRSRCKQNLVDKELEGEVRKGRPRKVTTIRNTSKTTIRSLLNFIKPHLGQEYHVFVRNCQDFARACLDVLCVKGPKAGTDKYNFDNGWTSEGRSVRKAGVVAYATTGRAEANKWNFFEAYAEGPHASAEAEASMFINLYEYT